MLASDFVLCGAIFKDHSFYEEVEWRVISAASVYDSRLRVKATQRRLVPYLEFNLATPGSPIALQTLIVGPADNAKLAFQATTMFGFAHKSRISIATIRPSRVPLRVG